MSAFGDPGVFASFTTWPGGAEARFNSLKYQISMQENLRLKHVYAIHSCLNLPTTLTYFKHSQFKTKHHIIHLKTDFCCQIL